MGQLRSAAMIFTLVFMSLVLWTKAQGPIPAADIPTQCNSVERCCMPTPYTGTPGIRQFELNEISSSSWRVRRPAHLLQDWEVARLEKAYALIRALPDSDPRSLLNQMNIHCLYCDNALYYPGQEYPLEIHDSWFFLPWHRMFLYWHERILAKVLEDDAFALPFWAWDSTETTDPLPNTMPVMYANPSSSLWNLNRNNCSYPPFLIDLDNRGGGCNNKTEDFIRVQNERLIYSQLVTGAPTTALM
jgi:polyphenol oxidase